MPISLDEVRHVARLARLDLDESEIVTLQAELNALIGHFSDIKDIDTSGIDIDFEADAMALHNVWADDLAEDSLPQSIVLRNSALTKAGLFVVPTIIED